MNADKDVPTASPQIQDEHSIAPQTTTLPGTEHSSSSFDLPRSSFERRFKFESSMTSKTTSVSVAVDPVALITTECITVTSAMRKHARWAHSSVSSILGGSASSSLQNSRPGTPRDELVIRNGQKGRPSIGPVDGSEDGGLANRWGLRGKKGKSMQDNPLMAGFGRLRRELVGCKGRFDAFEQYLKMLTYV